MTGTAAGRAPSEQLAAAYLRGERLVLVFDYDGTLAPFAARPELAHLDPAMRGSLARLAATPRVAVGVVSGRALDDLMAMVGLPGLYFGGTWGLELNLRGERIVTADISQPNQSILDLIAALEATLPSYPGAWVEKKRLGLTIHYRQVSADRAESLQAELVALLEPRFAALRVYQAPLAIEVLPKPGPDKSTALKAIATHGNPARPAFVLYAGDTTNDADALTLAAEWGGIALGVGPEPPAAAEYHLPGPEALAELLAGLADTLTAVRSIA
ncbi:MAG TPA: trehalose-phosphatase [Candidatus Competibacter sp.]|nr:trehalose-phosphatase [Candidatus Competibacter sp.]